MIKNKLTTIAASLMLLSLGNAHAGNKNYWKNLESKVAPSAKPMRVSASTYNIFSLNNEAMRSFLNSVDENPENAKIIELPTPDFQFKRYRIWKTPIMEKELADKYQEIQTFTAELEDNPAVTAKIEMTVFGFSAMVYDGGKTYFIDPYNNENDGYYVAFYKKNYIKTGNFGGCEFNKQTGVLPGSGGTPATIDSDEDEDVIAPKTNGSVRRTYRLALSCTGEYAIAVVGLPNPTKPMVFSKMVSTVNRINGYYQREVAVEFNLIAANETIIFTDPATDPYNGNLNLSILINEVQTVVTNNIGEGNYDIGHILCTAGGGLAQLNAICASGSKARGTSTSGSPNDVGTILHELGHQFGANHTFSANSGGCNGNGNEPTAYESGAGVTIMSYSGACAPNNAGFAEDEYFHVSSLNEITSVLNTQGNTCGSTATGNAPVVVVNLADSFNIPKNTPFELMAPISTASPSNAAILYNWEQWDLGNFGETEANNGNSVDGPLFRSYDPSTNRNQTYPIYTEITSGNYGVGPTGAGQRMANVARTIRFKLIARSVFLGWGTHHFIDSVVRLKVDENASNFRVTSHPSSDTWNPGEVKTITWDVGNTTSNNVNTGSVNIFLSLDDGKTFTHQLVTNAPNNGSYNITVPDVYTTKGRIKVKGAANVFFDINKGEITINGNPNSVKNVAQSNQFAIYPNPATNSITVSNALKNKEQLKLVMYNAIGQKVWDGTLNENIQIKTDAFARGNYMIQATDNKGNNSTLKVVLQ